MNWVRQLLVVLAATLAAGAPLAAAGAPAVREPDIDKAVAALADYDSGKSRRPLFQIESIIRRCTGRPKLTRHLERQLVKLLGSGATDECKLFVCQQLWVIGSDETAAAETVRRMLLDEKTSHPACYALGKSPSPQAGKALRDALTAARGKARIGIINQLGQRRDQQSVEALAGLIGNKDGAAVEAALAALGKIGGDQAAKVLARARKTPDARLRAAATDAYLQCARGLARRGSREQAVAIYRELHAPGEAPLIRRAALVGLVDAAGAQAVGLIVSTLRGDDAMMKATAIANVAALKGEEVTRRFAAELPGLSAPMQALLIGALVERGDAQVLPALAAAAGGPNAEVRTAAVKGIGRLGDASSVPLLARAVAEPKSDAEKAAALVGLRRLGGEGVDAAIIRSMRNAKAPARARLIQVLHDRNVTAAVPALLEQAAEADPNVRRAALRALGALAGPGDLPALIELLVGLRGEADRAQAEAAVVDVSRKVADEARRADAALAALRDARTTAARASLIRVLRGIANAKAFEAVRAAVQSPDAGLRDAAIRAMADWPDERAADVLPDIFRRAPDKAHRVLALRGLVRLLRRAGGRPGSPGRRRGKPGRELLAALGSVVAQVREPAEKRLVLGGLAGVGHPAALKMVEPWLDDKEVAAEAALATIAIARAVMGSHRAEARAAAKKVAATTARADLRKQAEQILRAIDRLDSSDSKDEDR